MKIPSDHPPSAPYGLIVSGFLFHRHRRPCSFRRFASCLALCGALAGATFARAEEQTFNRVVRPILSDNCFRCHGPDAQSRQADLRLDVREDALASVIVPGRPDESELVRRIFSENDDERMPPPDSRRVLSAEEKQVLRRWIESGAEYEPHWSLIPVPETVDVPESLRQPDWARNGVDAFVLEHLEQAGWEPAGEAPRERWLRRVTFELTGLPPSLGEIDEFLADDRPYAYERVVDRLLASPAYGERMANDWLDLARYADTYGYQADRDMHVWPWRDWLIRAFAANVPFNDFVTWQLAGDLLEHPTRDQVLATAFNRLHRQTNEGGSIEAEFRAAYVADRVQTVGTAFLGLTLECCRCHEHKFDPLSQRDFYSLAAFFDNVDEHGLYSHFTETAPTPALLLYDRGQEEGHRSHQAEIRRREAALHEARLNARSKWDPTSTARPAVVPAASAAFAFEDVSPPGDGRVVSGRVGQAIEFGGDEPFVCRDAGKLTRTSPFSFALWVKPGTHRPREVVLHRSRAAEDSAFRGYSLVLDQGRPVFSLIHFWPGNALVVAARQVIPAGEWTHVVVTYDGSSAARGLRLYVDGAAAELDAVRDNLTRDIIHRAEWGDYDAGSVELSLGARFRDVGFKGGAIDELAVYDLALTPVEAALVAGVAPPEGEAERFEHFLARENEEYRTAESDLRRVRNEENDFVSQVRQVMVMRELPFRRPTHVLKRGAYDAPGEAVSPDAPASILPFDPAWPRNRLGLARWMTDPRHPLTSRVEANRLWRLFFGRGLVSTPEDFGSQGQPPTHPQLLDYLARELMDSDWDTKAMCRLIALSATFRQSSVPSHARLYSDDPDNRLLARGPRFRLSAEQIRDNALIAAGLLDARIGGPSVYPYQPAGLWEESGTGKTYRQSHGGDVYRRSLYTFWRRTSPPPNMLSFDAMSREVCVARREGTTTPLQALVLLNDPQFVEAARVLAQRTIIRHPESVEARIETAFRLLTSRFPSPEEREVLTRQYGLAYDHFAARPNDARAIVTGGESPPGDSPDLAAHAALTIVAATLLNFDECITLR
jgi:hypothetical protein